MMRALSFGVPLEQLSLDTYWEKTEHLWKAAAELLGVGVTTNGREKTVEGLQAVLHDYGVVYFDASEITKPRLKDLAMKVAARHLTQGRFILPTYMWLMYGVLFTVADIARIAAKAPITVRNTWRPRPYNLRVSTAPQSDHIWTPAADLDFTSWMARRRASKALAPYQASGLLRMSIGTGRKTIHLGLFAPKTLVDGKKKRNWKYGNPDTR